MEATHYKNELHLAAETDNFQSAKELLARGTIDVNDCSAGGHTPLMLALARGEDLRMSRLLLKSGANVNKVSTVKVNGHSALSMCVALGDMPKVTFLVRSGADVNGRVYGGASPLHVATRGGNTGMMKYLLLCGADPLISMRTLSDTVGLEIVLDVAAQNGELEVVRTLFKYGKGLDGCGGLHRGRPALETAVRDGNLGVVQTLSEEGVQDRGGALHLALQRPDCSIIEHLLRTWETNRHSMDDRYMLKRNSQGDSVLMVAVTHPEYPSACRRVRFLLEAGANADCGRFLLGAGADAVRVTSEEHSLATIIENKVQSYKRESSEDYMGERLAAIGRLLRQVEAIHARSWLWPLPGPGETARTKKGGCSDGFAIMLKNMKRRAVVNVAFRVLRINECRIAVESAVLAGDVPPGCATFVCRHT